MELVLTLECEAWDIYIKKEPFIKCLLGCRQGFLKLRSELILLDYLVSDQKIVQANGSKITVEGFGQLHKYVP